MLRLIGCDELQDLPAPLARPTPGALDLRHTTYRAYLLKETLASALDYRQPARARRAIDDWLAWASRSRLATFVRLARTIRKHKDDILAYIDERITNGLVEGINNKLRAVARRAFGYHTPSSPIAMLYLVAGRVRLEPPLPGGPLGR